MNENLQKMFNSIPKMYRGFAMNAIGKCNSPEEVLQLATNYNFKITIEDAKELYDETHKQQ